VVLRRQPKYTQSKTYVPRERQTTTWAHDPNGAWAVERNGEPRFADLNEARSHMEALGLKSLKLYWIRGGVVRRSVELPPLAPPF
jgi:hypothetical protein